MTGGFSMGRFGLITVLALAAVLVGIGLIYKHAGYKVCPACSARKYFQRGLEYSCNKDKDYQLTALRFIKRAAERGELEAGLLLAELYLRKFPTGYAPVFQKQTACLARVAAPDKKTAVTYFEQVAEGLGKRKAVPADLLLNLYFLYSQGILPAGKPEEAAQRWLLKAAEAGSHSGMVFLAKAANARGDSALAKKWFETASKDPADWESPLMVGDYYFYGKGVPVDYVQAEKWYQKACQAAGEFTSSLEPGQEKTEIEAAPRVRLDILRRRLAAEKGGRASRLEYRLEGRVKEYLVYVKALSGQFELAGRVVNKNGKIIASMNGKLKYASPPPAMEKDGFNSMVEGMKWVLTTCAAHLAGSKAGRPQL